MRAEVVSITWRGLTAILAIEANGFVTGGVGVGVGVGVGPVPTVRMKEVDLEIEPEVAATVMV